MPRVQVLCNDRAVRIWIIAAAITVAFLAYPLFAKVGCWMEHPAGQAVGPAPLQAEVAAGPGLALMFYRRVRSRLNSEISSWPIFVPFAFNCV